MEVFVNWCLYHLDEDIAEQNNIANKHPEKVASEKTIR